MGIVPDALRNYLALLGWSPGNDQELFELDEFGNARVRGSGRIPPALEDQAWIARANCPELAVEIVEEAEAPD